MHGNDQFINKSEHSVNNSTPNRSQSTSCTGYIDVAAARQSHYSHLLNSISYIGAERVKKFLFNMQKVIDFNDVSSTYTYYIIVHLIFK